MPGGRGNKYDSHVKPKLDVVAAWARNGLTDQQISSNLGVGYSNFMKYKKQEEELREVLKAGKDEADMAVENALYKKAIEGDNVAMIFWLKNRRPMAWRDKQDIEQNIQQTSDNKLVIVFDEGMGD